MFSKLQLSASKYLTLKLVLLNMVDINECHFEMVYRVDFNIIFTKTLFLIWHYKTFNSNPIKHSFN